MWEQASSLTNSMVETLLRHGISQTTIDAHVRLDTVAVRSVSIDGHRVRSHHTLPEKLFRSRSSNDK
jgi:hypothetical protein